MTDEITPKYQLLEVLPDGTERRLYPNGHIRNQLGQLLQLPEEVRDMVITPENAEQFRKARKRKIIEEIEKNVMGVTGRNTPAQAIGMIVGKRAEIAMNDDTRTGNEAAKIVLAALDAYQDKPDEKHVSTTRHEYVMDDETRALLQDMIQKRRTVIDVEAKDVGDEQDGLE